MNNVTLYSPEWFEQQAAETCEEIKAENNGICTFEQLKETLHEAFPEPTPRTPELIAMYNKNMQLAEKGSDILWDYEDYFGMLSPKNPEWTDEFFSALAAFYAHCHYYAGRADTTEE